MANPASPQTSPAKPEVMPTEADATAGGAAGQGKGRGHWLQRPAGPRIRPFGAASEEPYKRRVKDWALFVVATGLLVGSAVHADHPSAIEVNVFQLVNGLPVQLSSTFRAFSAAGTLWALALAVTSAVVGRRWRLARDLLLAGLAAWAAAHVAAAIVAGNGWTESLRAVTHVRGIAPQFPLARVAMVVAVVSAAAPYLARPTRRISVLFVVLTAFSALYMGDGLPDDVLGGVFLGLAIGAGVHLVFGSPGGRPTSLQVTAALGELGVQARGVHLASKQRYGATLMVGTDEAGPLMVRVLGRDEADSELVQKFWRSIVYKGSGPNLYLTRLQEIEHSAFVTIVAQQHGVRTPQVLVAGQAGPKTALLAERGIGPVIADIDSAEVSDENLLELWRQVGLLHRARISHGNLDTAHVAIGSDGPAIIGFGGASMLSSATFDHDVVSLLVSTAAIVGSERAVAALTRALGPGTLATVLPLLQPAALSQDLRSLVGHRNVKATLDHLRSAGAAAAGAPAPHLQQLHRVSGTNLVLAVASLVAVFALLGQVSKPAKLWQTFQDGDWTWVAIAFGLAIATTIPYAIALMGTVPRALPLRATIELQLSMSFTNLAVPAVGGVAAQVRFLQKQGIDLASAVAAGGLLSAVANAAVNIGLFALAVAFSPNSFHFGSIPVGGILPVVLGIAVAAALATAILLGVPRLRRALVPPVRQATSTVLRVISSPRQLALLGVGFSGADILAMFCVAACLKAFGATLSLWTLLALSVGVQTLSSLVPVPGGGTTLSAVGMSGLLSGFGVPAEAAVAAVFARQLVTSYLPAVPGWFVTHHLISRDEL